MIFILARIDLVSYMILYLYYILSLLTLPLAKLPQRLYIYAIISKFLFVDALAPWRDCSRGTIIYVLPLRNERIAPKVRQLSA